jgi:hypothetical protein
MTDELSKVPVQKFDVIHIERSNEYKRHNERSYDKMKIHHRPNMQVNQEKEPRSTVDLPMIKNSKHTLEEISPTCKNLLPRSKDKLNDLLISEQLLNKSSVVNVLKLSRL